MSPQQNTPPGTLSSLEPLRIDGQDALAADPSDKIAAVRLRRLATSWHNAQTVRIISEARDLFSAAAADPSLQPLPENADLTEATLEFEFTDSPETTLVDIRPPSALIFTDTADHSRVTRFLEKHHFISLLLALLLAGPTDLDLEDDSDQEETEHQTKSLSA